jgi:hypothetical protein
MLEFTISDTPRRRSEFVTTKLQIQNWNWGNSDLCPQLFKQAKILLQIQNWNWGNSDAGTLGCMNA